MINEMVDNKWISNSSLQKVLIKALALRVVFKTKY